jgi:cyclase
MSLAPVQKTLHELGNGNYAYVQHDGSWGWSNSGLVTDAGQALLVDTLFDLALTREMLDTYRRAVPAAGRIGALVNTHANGDHTFGNQLVPGAQIIASRRCAEEMPAVPPELLAAMKQVPGPVGEYVQRIFGPFRFDDVVLTLPDRTFDGELTLRVGDKQVRLVEVGPAHTQGDTVVFVPEDRVVYTGDILFAGGHPIVWAGPIGNWLRALDLVMGLEVDAIVPGHGPLTDKRHVSELRGYFEYLDREARGRFDAGMSAAEAARDISLADYSSWGEAERIVANVDALYHEYSGAERMSPLEVFAEMAALAARR